MNDSRWLWNDEQHSGPFTIDQLYCMAKRGKIDHRTLFWSDRCHQWLPLRGLIFDVYPSRLGEMRRAGITRVRVIDSGTGEDCSVCQDLAGRTYPIDAAPTLPAKGCTCVPWCRCIIIAKCDED